MEQRHFFMWGVYEASDKHALPISVHRDQADASIAAAKSPGHIVFPVTGWMFMLREHCALLNGTPKDECRVCQMCNGRCPAR